MVAAVRPDVAAEVERLMRLPYRRELISYDDGTWFAQITELPGCMTEGDSVSEALEMLADAMRLWFTDALMSNDKIPVPAGELTYSGKFQVRIPPSLHRELSEYARNEGVSINQIVTVAVTKQISAH
jgi:antitoxin HicB